MATRRLPADYIHSSAGFYKKGIQEVYAVDNIRDVLETGLSKRI